MNGHVLITGASGFLGGGCVREFTSRGWRVTALVHNKIPQWLKELGRSSSIQIIKGSVTEKSSIQRAINDANGAFPLNAVIHCAGWASDTGRKTNFERVTLCGTRNTATAVLNNNIPRFVHISTTDVYGIKPHDEADESTQLDNNLKNNYPGYKIMAEEEVYRIIPKEKRVIIRPAAVWGEYDTTILPRIISFLRASPVIINFGKLKGGNRWPHVYIGNFTKLTFATVVLDRALGEVYNICDVENTSIDSYYRFLIRACLSSKKTPHSISLPLWVGVFVGRISDALSRLFNTYQPLFDPSSYGAHSVSTDMKFSSAKAIELLAELDEQLIPFDTAFQSFSSWARE